MSKRLLWVGLLLGCLGQGVGAEPPADWQRLQRHALAAPASVEANVDDLARYLAQAGRTPQERAWLIYRWLTDRISYDTAGFFSGHPPQDWQSALRTRKAVCAGYSRLFLQLARRAGLEAKEVVGTSKGFGSTADGAGSRNQFHSWVAVKLPSGWALLDPTWGAGFLQKDGVFRKRYSEFYFATPPQQFIYDHFPQETRWQLLGTPWSRERFDSTPKVTSHFFGSGLQPLSHTSLTIVSDGETSVTLRRPHQLQLMAQLLPLSSGELPEGNWTLTESEGSSGRVQFRCPERQDYRLRIYGTTHVNAPAEGTAQSFDWLMEYKVKARRARPIPFPRIFSPFTRNGCRLTSPREGKLVARRTLPFRISIPGAEEVMVRSSNGPRDFPLKRRGDQFSGDISPPAGKLTVLMLHGRSAGEKHYLAVLEYEVR